jgi:LacI family transcriptional regulator
MAGVSTQTVSRVLNNRRDVAIATRERILKIIVELEFSPSEAARSLVRQRSKHKASVIGNNLE